MNKNLKIFLTGGWGYGNRGDNAILAGTLSAIDSLGRSVDLSVTSFSAEELKTKHHLESSPSVHALLSFRNPLGLIRWPFVLLWRVTGLLLVPSLRRQLREMSQADLIIFGGGGYFNDTWKDAFPSRIVELQLAKASGRPYVVLGQTVGPFSDKNASEVLPDVLGSAATVAYRDIQSGDILKLAKVPASKSRYTADLAHLIKSTGRQPWAGSNGGKVRIGLMLQTFRKYEARAGLLPYGRIPDVETYLKKVLALVGEISRGRNVHFVMIASTSWDEKFMRRVESGIRSLGITPEVPDLENAPVSDFINACQSVDLMLSTNMHPVILSSLVYTPTIALSYHFKLDDYMNRIGRAPFCHRIDDFEVAAVAAQVNSIVDNGHDVTPLKVAVDSVVSDASGNLNVINDVLGRS